jgi:phosphoribosylanthranilate isomerase
MSIIRVKICGITRYEDARLAANLGADALGFIFYKKSPRFITPVKAREIIRRLPPFITRVGVFIDEEPSIVAQTIVAAGLDTVQFHGSESPEYCRRFTCSVIKTFSVQPGFDIAVLDDYKVSGLLLDTWDAKARGGTGKTFDWETAKLLTARRDNIILAGGLGPSNLADALETVHPYAVDLNSGVEIRPGEKNPQKLRDAITIVKNWK